jgi:hypothetical protein
VAGGTGREEQWVWEGDSIGIGIGASDGCAGGGRRGSEEEEGIGKG